MLAVLHDAECAGTEEGEDDGGDQGEDGLEGEGRAHGEQVVLGESFDAEAPQLGLKLNEAGEAPDLLGGLCGKVVVVAGGHKGHLRVIAAAGGLRRLARQSTRQLRRGRMSGRWHQG